LSKKPKGLAKFTVKFTAAFKPKGLAKFTVKFSHDARVSFNFSQAKLLNRSPSNLEDNILLSFNIEQNFKPQY
jgi:hypothetical protein